MANCLPVLLVSVTNASIVPDDSSVSTLPRGQVDYLSHDWQEEDVWRSWRKMTRQKNEITNGPRLENASWRTWWKQRNKLKTVTPETLNWLKDSDVTWLYGPLHTAAEWTPPARLIPHPTGSSRRGARHKPILKYRSISELLTSELPTSPVFSPSESETEAEQQTSEAQNVSVLNGQSPNSKRPALVHTQSDTHIARWDPNRAFCKDPPPRVGSSSGCIATSQTKTSVQGYFSQSHSQDSNSSTGTSTTGLINQRACHTTHKRKHISFNTFVEQCISIEKPNDEDVTPKFWGERKWDYDDGYEEDEEDDDDDDSEIWIRHTPHHPIGCAIAGSGSVSGEDEGKEAEEEADELLEMRPRSYRGTPRKQRVARSPSTSTSISTPSSCSPSTSASISTPSSRSTSSSSPSRSLSPSSSSWRQISTLAHPIVYTPRGSIRRSSTTNAYRPRPRPYSTSHHPFMRTQARGDSIHNGKLPHVHVTIAPIAPTILKTTDSGYDGWAEGFGDEGGSDDGFWGSKWGAYTDREGWKERNKIQSQDDKATPVELVYVPPPFVGPYPVGSDEEDFDIDAEDERFEEQREDDTLRPSSNFAISRIVDDAPIAESPTSARNDFPFVSAVAPPTPTVIVESQPLQASEAQKHSICISEVTSCSPSNGQDRRPPFSPEDRHSASRSRSRTHSRSRTPSPAVSLPSHETSKNVAALVPVSVGRRSLSISPPNPPSSLLCPPVQRGRSASYQDLPARGRSSARTPPSYSDREHQGESPIGSLSPDSSFIGVASIVGGVYANGRTDKERQKEKERREEQYRERDRGRGGERGRDRTGRKPNQTLNPDIKAVTSRSFFAEGRADESSAPIKRASSILEETYYITGTAQAPTTTYMQEDSRPLCESPLLIPPPQPIEPSTLLIISPPGAIQPLPVKLPQQSQSHASPTETETTIVEKAVGIMSSAGVFLGLWHS
ncbi:hypothetical protein F5887DRAFT_954734 [Amanita rubescens]|nr:hypothetical protein F5887DRAFT_954734 [Amanita rubescens]